MRNKRMFITGGAGYLGTNIIKKYYDENEITIYSRDEAKHYYLKKQFPRLKCVVGDIRNYDLLLRSSKKHDIGIFAASMKQIEAVDQNVSEGVEIIVNGALNSRRVAEENHFESACFISTDKSRAATTLYGAMKFVAGESFIVDAEKSDVKLSCAIYGNVTNSTGSVIPLIKSAIEKKFPLTLYSDKMTRFMIDVEDAVSLIEYSLGFSGFNIIPKLNSYNVKDLFELYNEKFDLQYNIGTPRISEKLHEIMLSHEEVSRVKDHGKYLAMHYQKVYNECEFPNNEFSSKDVCLTKAQLKIYLENKGWFYAN